LPKHPTTPLAESQINRSRNVITIELVEPDDRPTFPIIGTPPTFVRIVWPVARRRRTWGRSGVHG